MKLPKDQQPVLQSVSQDMRPCAKKPDGFMTFYFPGLILNSFAYSKNTSDADTESNSICCLLWDLSSSNQFWNCWELLLMTTAPTTCAKQRPAQFTMQQRTLRWCGIYWFTLVQRLPAPNWESNRLRRQKLPSSMKCFGCLECSINKQCLLILQSLAVIVVDRAIGH